MSARGFKFITPEDFKPFDPNDADDMAAEAEKRALCDFFLRRIKKGARDGMSEGDIVGAIVAGGMTALCGLFIAAAGDKLDDDALDKMHDILGFCWIQALSHGSGSVQ